MIRKTFSRREHLLLIAACLVLAGMGYFAIRYYPAGKTVAKLKQETAEALAKQKGIDLPNAPATDLAALEKEEQEIAAALAEVRAAIAELEQGFAPTDAPEVLHGVQVEIIELARENGMEVLEHVPYGHRPTPAKTGGEPLSGAAGGGVATPPEGSDEGAEYIYGRPMRQFRMAASYDGIKGFIRGLDRLSWRVTLVQWGIEAEVPGETGAYGWPLVATVVLAL